MLLFTFVFIFVYFAAPCSEKHYKCDVERCINSSLICQGHNPCGDGSDCKITPSPGMYICEPPCKQNDTHVSRRKLCQEGGHALVIIFYRGEMGPYQYSKQVTICPPWWSSADFAQNTKFKKFQCQTLFIRQSWSGSKLFAKVIVHIRVKDLVWKSGNSNKNGLLLKERTCSLRANFSFKRSLHLIW